MYPKSLVPRKPEDLPRRLQTLHSLRVPLATCMYTDDTRTRMRTGQKPVVASNDLIYI